MHLNSKQSRAIVRRGQLVLKHISDKSQWQVNTTPTAMRGHNLQQTKKADNSSFVINSRKLILVQFINYNY